MKMQTNWSSRVGRPRDASQDMQTGIFFFCLLSFAGGLEDGEKGVEGEKGRGGEGERRGRLNPSCRITL